ncbi:FAD-dependent oxidoreductase [Prauserella muralis]|uniref:Cholesterol oxidase n=1 Tax=Prauserella muralis TaxID=588067 RepID=A0A2V4BEX0_9PSEU|nr:GMC family oxidoreductase [Prauserella muralis]PXY32589.1 FAD-dependent oxidoreductase [Prauserella muralis]TWE23694.1 cholesterol oxidase [Prauserella muralis]
MRPEHVDAVVVGSGFGGAVSAYRLAEAGKSVVVLERGKAYAPGSFPRSPAQMGKAFWDPPHGLHGMFDVWSFRGFDSLVSSGLGGGSLIYANVLLRKDERWFVHEDPLPGGGFETWPVTRADLDPHYDAVEAMLRPEPYPLDAPAYASTRKTVAMRDAAGKLGLDWQLPPLAVSFRPHAEAEPAIGLPIVEPSYGNVHGAARSTCRLCGECDIGCNDGAKNSLDHNYLSAARSHGADLRTRHEVRGLRALGSGGYEVAYVVHDDEGRDPSTLDVHRLTCDRLILAAGTYGTTYLLLRNRSRLPGLSAALGSRFCGNGDLLTFLLPGDGDETPASFEASRGPVITSAVRVDDGPGTRGFYIEDGGYPGFTDWLVESGNVASRLFRSVEFVGRWLLTLLGRWPDNRLGAELSRLLGDGTLSAGSLPLLGMGRDVPDGVMRLRGDLLDVDWTTETSRAFFDGVRETMQDIAGELGARYVDNPMWFFRRVITVHPLGGAPIGRHPGEGVCDPYGEVFGLPGLHVADGAALPGPVGANPSLTIAALADRMSTRLLEG